MSHKEFNRWVDLIQVLSTDELSLEPDAFSLIELLLFIDHQHGVFMYRFLTVGIRLFHIVFL